MLFSTEIGLLWMTVDVMGHDQIEPFFNSAYGIAVVNWLIRRRITEHEMRSSVGLGMIL